jgi:hypothetical protein
MTPRLQPGRSWRGTIALTLLLAPGSAMAQTPCDTDPNAVPFEATVDPTTLNNLLARLGNIDVRPPNASLTLGGVCVDHQVPVTLDLLALPVGQAPFTVTPSVGRLEVDLEIPGPFELRVDGGNYRAVNCDSTCVVEVPYVGTLFNGCSIEAGIVRPVLGLLDVSASWDDIRVTQVADTCVLGDCTAVHPLQSTQATLFGFDIDATGFGSCGVCLDFPDPFPDPPCFDPCDGIDPLLTGLVRPVLEDAVEGAFENRQGEGTLINVFSQQIVKDGCADIPEVRDCKANLPPAAQVGLMRRPRDHGLNAALYSLPFMVAAGLSLRLRRRGGPGQPPKA